MRAHARAHEGERERSFKAGGVGAPPGVLWLRTRPAAFLFLFSQALFSPCFAHTRAR